MLGFILSKLNLLILVVAIAAIIVFFTAGLSDIIVGKSADLLLKRFAEKTSTVASSQSYCFSDSFYLPKSLNVGGEEVNYVITADVQKIPIDPNDPSKTMNVVIFSLYQRRDFVKHYSDPAHVPSAISAFSVRTNANIYMFNPTYTGTYTDDPIIMKSPGNSEGDFVIDTEAANNARNTVIFLKQKIRGQDYFYLFACDNALCFDVKNEFSKSLTDDAPEATYDVTEPNKEGAFSC